MSTDDDRLPGEGLARRWRVWLPAIVIVLALVGVAAALFYRPSVSAASQSAECPPASRWPALSAGPPLFTDNNLAVFVGGDYSAAAPDGESEGILVVLGSARFGGTGEGTTEIGSVSIGSRVAPTPGTAMLAVGGDLEVARTARVEVGSLAAAGGQVIVGGRISAGSSVDTNGGGVRQRVGADAVASFAGFHSRMTDESRSLASHEPTGTFTLTDGSLYLTGDAHSARQYFEVPGDLLASTSVIDFVGIPEGAAVVITVSGASVDFRPDQFQEKGVRVDAAPTGVTATVSARTLWNFTEAKSVSIAGPGTLLGSVLVPEGSLDLATNTNGRIYVGGDLTKSGSASQQHNYAWIGSGLSACQAARASVHG